MVWFVIAAGVAFIALGLVFAGRFGTDPGISSSPLIGIPAPTSPIALMESEGVMTIAELSGDIVVVNFWASWCFGCQQEHEALVNAAEDYASFDTTFVAINYQDSPDRAEAFLNELGRSAATIYVIDEGSSTAFEWGVLGLPETFFVDRDGIVVGKVSGPVTYGLLSQTIERILIGESIGEIKTGEVENR
jgi:cytochrome c biogenesis protein CcmG/thiol:disulfide interchange protein DsbE